MSRRTRDRAAARGLETCEGLPGRSTSLLRPRASRAARGRRGLPRGLPGRDPRAGRRDRLRQVDAGALPDPAVRRDRGRGRRFDGQRHQHAVASRSMRPLRREIQMIFQDPYGSLNPRRRVGSIIGDAVRDPRASTTRAERKRRVQELMELVGLNPEHYNRFPAEFSGGQRQRIGVARALALQPEADRLRRAGLRPRRLDPGAGASTCSWTCSSEFGLTYVFITHDLSVVRHVSDRIAVMYLGKIVETAPSEELFDGAAAPLHPGAALGAAAGRPGRRRQPRARSSSSGDMPVARRTRRRVPLPPPLPQGQRDCAERGPAARSGLRRRAGPPARRACHPLQAGRGPRRVHARDQDTRDHRRSTRSRTRESMTAPHGDLRARARHADEPRRGSVEPIKGRGPWELAWRRLRKDKVAMVSLVVIVLIVLMAIFAPLFAHADRPPAEHAVPRDRPDADGLPVAPERRVLVRHRRPGPRRAGPDRLRRPGLPARRRDRPPC